jgi:hypothetical protein
LFGCSHNPDFIKDGKEYYVTKNCSVSHTECKLTYHYGYSMGKWKWHYGPEYSHICDKYTIDTVSIK